MSDVAPFAGAWIEILLFMQPTEDTATSLPSRERGLKFLPQTATTAPQSSLPSRERGLKYKM